MFTSLRDAYVLHGLIALMPGAISWWSGRRLVRLVDDPVLPELFAAHRQRTGMVAVIAMVSLGFVASWTSFALLIPLLLAGYTAAAYPLRRVLYHETWSFGSYLWLYPRVIVGIFGFWLVFAAMPHLTSLAGRWDWLAGGALAVVLLLWNHFYAEVARFCLRTRPIEEGEFLSRCRALADACGVPQPRFERIDLGGGVIANALALPSLRTPSVLFTDTLLERFDRQELLAVCAHELAHFEHYNPRFLRRLNIVTYSLLAFGAAYPPIVRLAGFESSLLPLAVWLAAFLAAMAMRARDKQQQETACDLRAVELTGDADALVRGLTRLYTIARVPRRTEQQRERSATHPSLARRIRDIRKAAGVAPVALGGGHSFTSADGRVVVTFEDALLRWEERDAVTHSLSYTHLTELRVDARPGRASRLVAIGAAARRWEMGLAGADIARLQGVLDVVDSRLADPPRQGPRTFDLNIQKTAVLMAAAMALVLWHVTVAFVAFLAWVKPSLPLLAAAGLAALTAAGLVLRDGTNAYLMVTSLPIAVIGLVLLGFAWAHRHDDRQNLRPFIACLAVPAAAAAFSVIVNGLDAVRLHQSARGLPSAPVLFVALAGALACSKVRRVRIAGGAAAGAALVSILAGSTAFLDRFATDPFLVRSPALTWVSVGSQPTGEFDVPVGTSRIDLSPDGRYVAAYRDLDGDEGPATFQVGRIGQALSTITAEDVTFVDDDRLLVLESDSRGTTLKTLALGPSRDVAWQQFVEGLSAPSLSFDRETGRWRIMGRDADESVVRVEGNVGASAVQRRRWSAEDSVGGFVGALTTAGSDVLMLETRYERTVIGNLIPWEWMGGLVQPFRQVSRYATVGEHGRRTFGESALGVNCMADVLVEEGLACAVYDGTRTHIVKIDAVTGSVGGIGWLDGHFVSNQNAARGWLTGWAVAGAVAMRLTTGEVFRMPASAGVVSSVSVAGGRLAAVGWGNGHFTVRVYSLPPDPQIPETMRAQRAPDR